MKIVWKTHVEIQAQNALNALIIPQILPWIRPIYDTNCHPPAENGWEPKCAYANMPTCDMRYFQQTHCLETLCHRHMEEVSSLSTSHYVWVLTGLGARINDIPLRPLDTRLPLKAKGAR